MHRHPSLFERLTSRLSGELDRQMNLSSGDVLSITLSAAELPLCQLPAGLTGYRYWAKPASRRFLLGLGQAAVITAAGAGRLQEACVAFRDLGSRWRHSDPDDTELVPLAFVAFAFDPDDPMQDEWAGLPNTLIEVPSVLWQRDGPASAMTFSCRIAGADWRDDVLAHWLAILERITGSALQTLSQAAYPNTLTRIGARPAEEAWLAIAGHATSGIREKRLHKVVLARHVTVHAQRRLDPARVMASLAYRYPACTQFAVDAGERVLVAASPEQLVRVDGGQVSSDALAGTMRRSANEALDRRLQENLLDCAKSRHEHELVVNHVAAALACHCTEVRVPQRPEVLSLRFVHHLWSPLTGRLREECSLLDLLERLHPTPAVGGTPRAEALAWIRENEPLRRGWYTGALGWVTPAGDGELSVVLRCALVNGHHAQLFAGAGVVGDSNPTAELEETELKLQTLLDALQDA